VIHEIIQMVFTSLTSSIRKFTTFLILIVLLGMVLGARVEHVASYFLPTALMIPVVLAIMAYSSTDVAVILFACFLLVFLLLF